MLVHQRVYGGIHGITSPCRLHQPQLVVRDHHSRFRWIKASGTRRAQDCATLDEVMAGGNQNG